jgi:hypothetical protein
MDRPKIPLVNTMRAWFSKIRSVQILDRNLRFSTWINQMKMKKNFITFTVLLLDLSKLIWILVYKEKLKTWVCPDHTTSLPTLMNHRFTQRKNCFTQGNWYAKTVLVSKSNWDTWRRKLTSWKKKGNFMVKSIIRNAIKLNEA